MNIPDKAMDAAFQAATGGAELHLDDRMYWEQAAKDMLEAAAPFIAAQALRDAVESAREENEHIVPGVGAYSSGFHYALSVIEGTEDPQ